MGLILTGDVSCNNRTMDLILTGNINLSYCLLTISILVLPRNGSQTMHKLLRLEYDKLVLSNFNDIIF